MQDAQSGPSRQHEETGDDSIAVPAMRGYTNEEGRDSLRARGCDCGSRCVLGRSRPGGFQDAAKYCKAVRESKGVEAFGAQYATNKNKKNAFGKCVSQTAKAKAAKREDAKKDDAAESKATADCKKQQTADAAKFANDYKNFGQCVKTGKAKNGGQDDD